MSPPLLGVAEEGGQNNVTLLSPSAAVDSAHQQKMELKEHNYMGLSDCSSVNGTIMSNASDETKSSWNLKATELRLGLPGSQSPVRDSDLSLLGSSKLDEKPLFPLHPSNDGQNSSTLKQGNKRGFSDVMDGFSESKLLGKSDANVMLSPRPSANMGLRTCSGVENLGAQPPKLKEIANQKIAQESSRNANEMRQNHDGLANNSGSAPASKAQVVGWPPIRSFRKNSLATSSKNINEADGKAGPELFVKVSMDGAPYLRKVDLATYSAYQELSSALEKMFSCTIVGQFGLHGTGVAELLSDKKLNNLLRGSEYVLTYEDKDGDWMLVGDVPWEMFIDMCKKLRIMKHCDAIGLAPRAGEKTRSRN